MASSSSMDASTAREVANQLILAVNATFSFAHDLYAAIPGSSVVYKYIRDSHQNDPFRTFLEALLVIFMIWYIFMKKDKPGSNNDVKLTEKEIQDLCDEWEPEPLVPPLTEFQKSELEKLSVITSPGGAKVKLADGKERLNLASYNFLGLLNRDSIKEKAVEALRKYGVGSCGPPGFYGTLDVHMELEQKLASFLGTENAIIYSQGFSTISSVIPAFSKRGDILVVDEGINLSLLKGVELSRSIVKYFKHNDMEDLERVLIKIRDEAIKKKTPLTRRFILVEGLYNYYGDICNLPKVVELKEKYKYRLILEDSYGFGVLGETGRGTPQHFGIPTKKVDIYAASMANALCAGGGFCAGTREIVEHQRLSGLAYTFSASLPAIVAVSALEALHIIETTGPALLSQLRENTSVLRATLLKGLPPSVALSCDSDAQPNAASPLLHLSLRARLSPGGAAATGREEEERVLQDAVDAAQKDGVLVARAKYVLAQERGAPVPSIRIAACAGLTKKETEKAAATLREAVKKTLKAHRL
ncbi:pyridoxal phosphate-dependent transferase [Zopfochytrium polystomum]|nr:pyridoxal phosphate-dependent transferase [Zopfochytrium polystomum]